MDWLHDRMPAILPDEKSVSQWLDEDVHGIDALEALRPLQKGKVGKGCLNLSSFSLFNATLDLSVLAHSVA